MPKGVNVFFVNRATGIEPWSAPLADCKLGCTDHFFFVSFIYFKTEMNFFLCKRKRREEMLSTETIAFKRR